MIPCAQVIALLGEYVDRTLDPVVAEELQQHLERCRDCGPFLKEYGAVSRVARSSLEVRMPPELHGRLVSFLQEHLDPAARDDAGSQGSGDHTP